MATKSKPTVSNAEAFKKRRQLLDEGEVIELTSGITVRATRPSVPQMVSAGQIPASLAAAQFRIQTGRDTADKDVERLYKLQILVVRHAVLEPKIVETPDYDKGEISIDDLEEGDMTQIYAYVQGGLAVLDKFRAAGEGVHAGPSSETLPGNKAE